MVTWVSGLIGQKAVGFGYSRDDVNEGTLPA